MVQYAQLPQPQWSEHMNHFFSLCWGTEEQKGIKIELRHIAEGHQKYSLEKYVRKQDDGSSTL